MTTVEYRLSSQDRLRSSDVKSQHVVETQAIIDDVDVPRDDFNDLLGRLGALIKNADESGRKKAIDGLRDLAITFEEPQDSANRLMYSLATIRIALDLDLFEILTNSPDPVNLTDLGKKTGVEVSLLRRLCRYMASYRIIKETDEDTFTANSVTRTFTVPGFKGGAYHYFDFVGPGLRVLPDFLKDRQYRDVTSNVDTPTQRAHKTDLPCFFLYQEMPELFKHFSNFMVDQRLGMPVWLDKYSYETLAKASKPDQVFFVDVGGGYGHQSVALRKALPQLPNRIINQDLEGALENAIQEPGVELMAQNFFEEQKVKGAKIYYMRNIIHDYPEDKALLILKHLRNAMSSDSVILIDDMVIPNKGAHWQQAQLDLTMLICLGALERTRRQWDELIAKAGMKINQIVQYTDSIADCIIEVGLA